MNAKPAIFVCKTGSASTGAKQALRKAGFVVVELPSMLDYRIVWPELSLHADAIGKAAIKALGAAAAQTGGGLITEGGLAQARFVKLLAEALEKS